MFRDLRFRFEVGERGQVPEWPKGTGCKPVALRYRGSNPLLPTHYTVELSTELVARALVRLSGGQELELALDFVNDIFRNSLRGALGDFTLFAAAVGPGGPFALPPRSPSPRRVVTPDATIR